MRTPIVLATFVAVGLGCIDYTIETYFYYAKTHSNKAPSGTGCTYSACYYGNECVTPPCYNPPPKSNLDSWYSAYLNSGYIPTVAYMGTCTGIPPTPPPTPTPPTPTPTPPTPTPPTPTPTPPPPSPNNSDNSLLYVGIGVGVLVIIAIIVGVICCMKKKPAQT